MKMNKSNIILIISVVILGPAFLLISSANAQVQNLIVEFEKTPLFEETNFLPGDSVTRWVRVTNNSTITQRIATEAINVADPNRLGDVLNLEIKQGGITLYKDAFSKFFSAGEVFLSELAGNGTQTQYDFIVTFYSGAQNPFQGKTLTFDILIGFQGEEGGLLPGAGGGAGGFLPPALTIRDESVRVTGIGETSVTITWLTSYFSTSQVIYATEGEPHTLDLTDNIGTPPKYGYAHTTPEYDISPKVTAHSVTITDLRPGTTYYYRTVSHASLAISREYSFTTLGEKKPKEEMGGEIKPERGPPPTKEIIEEEIFEEVERPFLETLPPAEKEKVIPPEVISPFPEEAKRVTSLPRVFLASLADSWKDFLGGEIFDNLIFLIFLFLIGILLTGLSLIKRPRIIFGTLGFLGILSLFLASLWLPLPFVEQLRIPLPNWFTFPVGIFFFLLGLSIIYFAFKTLTFRVASSLEKPKILITTGVYKIVRHPIYLGLITAYFGWALLFKSLSALFLLPFSFLLLLILAIFEERDLIKIYGQSYQEYKRKTAWRLIPRII
jgi:protein-S-isoprenylcysteine O-methyltransferase Ste14